MNQKHIIEGAVNIIDSSDNIKMPEENKGEEEINYSKRKRYKY